MSNSTSIDNRDLDVSRIAGNASDEIKQVVGDPGGFFTKYRAQPLSSPMFGESIQKRLVVTEVSINSKAEEERKKEARLVIETDIHEDMLNGGGNIHGGCSAYLVDLCSSLALIALNMDSTGELYPSVSQSLNIVYHSPAQLGDRLRIVSTTLTLGARAHSARTEIWSVTHRRLVVSGTHIKMLPSISKAKPSL